MADSEQEQDFLDQISGQDDGHSDGDQNADLQNNDAGQEEGPQLSDLEQKAFDQGWRPEEEFSGPKDNWKTAKEYVKDGEWMSKLAEVNRKLDQQGHEFDDRLENTKKILNQRRLKDIADLKTQQRNAVDMSDTDAYDSAQQQIDDLEKQQAPVENKQPTQQERAIDPLVTAWVNDNQWINDPDDNRSIIAQGALTAFNKAKPNAPVQEAIDFVNKKVGELAPSHRTNPRRDQPNTMENGNRSRAPRNGKTLTMNDLTNSERKEYEQYGQSMFGSDKDFLKAVQDARVK